MKHLYWFGLLSCSLLLADPVTQEKGSLSSTNASYDGNALLLTGHVELDHGLGKMTAENASLQRQEVEKDFPFSLIELKQDVHLFLKNEAQLSCQDAVLDFTALTGVLLPKEGEYVVYTDFLKKNKESIALKFQGRQIDLDFAKETGKDLKTEYAVDTALADRGVLIDYADQFELKAEKARYLKETAVRHGLVTAYPKDETSKCHLTHCQDFIDADQIDLDLSTSKITLLHAEGVLSTARETPHATEEVMHFRAEILDWDTLKHSLELQKNIHIHEETFGTLVAKERLHILLHPKEKGMTAVRSLRAEGPTTLEHRDERNTQHKLSSQGSILIDREQLLANIDSPKEQNGSVSRDNQLYYEENEIAVYADQAHLEYALVENAIQPTSLTLKGNIRLFSHDPEQPFKCGIADRLTYSLTTQTLILSADPGRTVLFTDTAQGMHLAAPEVHITRDPETKEQNVKGVGKVHFAFTPEEQSKIQQFFPQLKKAL